MLSINNIDIHNFIHGQGTGCFSDMLLVLIAKADGINKEKLRKGFPEAVKMYDDYMKTGICPLCNKVVV